MCTDMQSADPPATTLRAVFSARTTHTAWPHHRSFSSSPSPGQRTSSGWCKRSAAGAGGQDGRDCRRRAGGHAVCCARRAARRSGGGVRAARPHCGGRGQATSSNMEHRTRCACSHRHCGGGAAVRFWAAMQVRLSHTCILHWQFLLNFTTLDALTCAGP